MATSFMLFVAFRGVFQTFDISQASVHNIHYLNDIKVQFSDCILIADRGYLIRIQSFWKLQKGEINRIIDLSIRSLEGQESELKLCTPSFAISL